MLKFYDMESFKEILESIHVETGLEKDLLRRLMQEFVDQLIEYGANEQPVYLNGLGEIDTKLKKEFMFEDSQTGRVTLYPPEKVARFKSRRDN